MSKQIQVDICLCTFRRPDLLRATLSSIENQQLPPNIFFKVFVVDNDVTASAKAVALEFIERGLINLSYDVEPEQNIALARNRSVGMGVGEFVAFIDDDEVADKNWLKMLYQCLQRYEAEAVFGPVLPVYPSNAPGWIKDAGLVDRPYYETGTKISYGRTGNTLIKRSLLLKDDGPFDSSYGLTGGSDSAFFRKVAKEGARLIWCNEAIVEEVVSNERMTIRFFIRRAYRGGQSYARIFLKDAVLATKVKWFCKRILYLGVIIIVTPIAVFFGPKRLFWFVRKLFLNLGQLSVISGRYFQEYRR